MTAPYHRSAAAALDEARPAVDRLDIGRDAEDLAADLIEAWEAAQRALRGLAGNSALRGQLLIREARQRELLTLDQAHALVDFAAAAERAHSTDYRPTGADIDAARAGFQQLEAAVLSGPAPAAPRTAPRAAVSTPEIPPRAIITENTTAVSGATGGMDGMRLGLVAVVGLVVLAALGGMGWVLYNRGGPQRTLDRAQQAYRANDRTTARNLFSEVAREQPDLALPHIYLGRMAREEGDVSGAARELASAVRLDPKNALAQREMGAHLLTSATAQINQGNVPAALQSLDLARNFYRRAVELDQSDRVAQGFLGCTLIRIGSLRNDANQMQLGLRFTSRAGQGDWSACERLAQQTPARTAPQGPTPNIPR